MVRVFSAQTILAPGLVAGLAACGEAEEQQTFFAPDYQGATAESLDTDLAQVLVQMEGARGPGDVTDYAQCAVAAFAVSEGLGYARHLRTNIDEEAGVWRADAVYTVSPEQPRGLQTIDAKATVAECLELGIPTV